MRYADIRSYMDGMMEQLISSPSVVPNCDQALSADMVAACAAVDGRGQGPVYRERSNSPQQNDQSVIT
jgi:hypothetical protein